jgi:hypothetical protein
MLLMDRLSEVQCGYALRSKLTAASQPVHVVLVHDAKEVSVAKFNTEGRGVGRGITVAGLDSEYEYDKPE